MNEFMLKPQLFPFDINKPMNVNMLRDSPVAEPSVAQPVTQLSPAQQIARRRESLSSLGADRFDEYAKDNAVYQNNKIRFPDLTNILRTYMDLQTQNDHGVFTNDGSMVDADTLKKAAIQQSLKKYNLDPQAAEEYANQYMNQLNLADQYASSREQMNQLNAEQAARYNARQSTGLTYNSPTLSAEEVEAYEASRKNWENSILGNITPAPQNNVPAATPTTPTPTEGTGVKTIDKVVQNNVVEDQPNNVNPTRQMIDGLTEAYASMPKNTRGSSFARLRAAKRYLADNVEGFADFPWTQRKKMMDEGELILRQIHENNKNQSAVDEAEKDLAEQQVIYDRYVSLGFRADPSRVRAAEEAVSKARAKQAEDNRIEYNGESIGFAPYNSVTNYGLVSPTANTASPTGSTTIARYAEVNPNTYSWGVPAGNIPSAPSDSSRMDVGSQDTGVMPTFGGTPATISMGSSQTTVPEENNTRREPAFTGSASDVLNRVTSPAYRLPEGLSIADQANYLTMNKAAVSQHQRSFTDLVNKNKDVMHTRLPIGLDVGGYTDLYSAGSLDAISDVLFKSWTGQSAEKYIEDYAKNPEDKLSYERVRGNIKNAIAQVQSVASAKGTPISDITAALIVKKFSNVKNYAHKLTNDTSLPANFANDAIKHVGDLSKFKENANRIMQVNLLQDQQKKAYDALEEGLKAYEQFSIAFNRLNKTSQATQAGLIPQYQEAIKRLYNDYALASQYLAQYTK